MTFKEYILEKKYPVGFDFKFNKEIYQILGINRKRLGLIFKGELLPDIVEAIRIAEHWNLTADEVFYYYKNISKHSFLNK